MKNRNLNHSDHWQTPHELLMKLHKEFNFIFDPCPLHANFDGLVLEKWESMNFVNPPYSLKLKTAFVKKAIEQKILYGFKSVLLLPVSTSTKLFHDYIKPNAQEIRFLRGRAKFIGVNTKGKKVSNNSGMHDSMVVVI